MPNSSPGSPGLEDALPEGILKCSEESITCPFPQSCEVFSALVKVFFETVGVMPEVPINIRIPSTCPRFGLMMRMAGIGLQEAGS